MGTTLRKTLVVIRLWTAIAFNLQSFVAEIESAIEGGIKGCNILIVDCNQSHAKNANRMDPSNAGVWLTQLHKAYQVVVQSDVTDKVGIIGKSGEYEPSHVSNVQPEARIMAGVAVARSMFPGSALPEIVIIPGAKNDYQTGESAYTQDASLLHAYRDAKSNCVV